MSEKTLEKKLREKIKELGGWALKFWSVSVTGLPDRLVLMPGGRAYFAEIKTTGKKPSPVQLATHRALLKLGFPVWVIDSRESLDRFFKVVVS